jgi:hypothetical protein
VGDRPRTTEKDSEEKETQHDASGGSREGSPGPTGKDVIAPTKENTNPGILPPVSNNSQETRSSSVLEQLDDKENQVKKLLRDVEQRNDEYRVRNEEIKDSYSESDLS